MDGSKVLVKLAENPFARRSNTPVRRRDVGQRVSRAECGKRRDRLLQSGWRHRGDQIGDTRGGLPLRRLGAATGRRGSDNHRCQQKEAIHRNSRKKEGINFT
jgi:hypothetical protein